MRHQSSLALAAGLAAMALPLVALPGAADHGGKPYTIELLGANEAPGPGDPDGSGTAHLTLNQGQSEVCWQIEVEGVDPILAAHIHRAPVGEPGPIVVPLNPFDGGCTTADAELIKEIRHNPEQFYVNVHNAAFEAGALRGQLG